MHGQAFDSVDRQGIRERCCDRRGHSEQTSGNGAPRPLIFQVLNRVDLLEVGRHADSSLMTGQAGGFVFGDKQVALRQESPSHF